MNQDTKIRELLAPVKRASHVVTAPPFLETRILAVLRERRHKSGALVFWRRFALGTATALILSVGTYVAMPKGQVFESQANTAVLVKVEALHNVTEIARVEVELPDGVTFYSKKYPELNGQRVLAVNWSEKFKDNFPFIVKSDNTGLKVIKVVFYDKDNRIAGEKFLKIRFAKNG